MTKIVTVYHSGYGHTKKTAEAVHAGITAVPGVEGVLVAVGDVTDATWKLLDQADAIVFGAPTYMGGPSADFKKFADATSKPWGSFAWKDKVAAGFTNSGSLNGDKLATLQYFVHLAMQHGMIWVGNALMPANKSTSTRDDINRMGSFTGLMTQADADMGPDVAPPKGDLETARLFGTRIGELTKKIRRA